MYGEWLYVKYIVFYDEFIYYFMEFDIYDKVENKFLSIKKRREIINGYDFIILVLVFYEGKLNKLKELILFLGKFNFKFENCKEVLRK